MTPERTIEQKSAIYDYLEYIENAGKPDEVKKAGFIVISTDGTAHRGITFGEAAEKAMIHDGWGGLPASDEAIKKNVQ